MLMLLLTLLILAVVPSCCAGVNPLLHVDAGSNLYLYCCCCSFMLIMLVLLLFMLLLFLLASAGVNFLIPVFCYWMFMLLNFPIQLLWFLHVNAVVNHTYFWCCRSTYLMLVLILLNSAVRFPLCLCWIYWNYLYCTFVVHFGHFSCCNIYFCFSADISSSLLLLYVLTIYRFNALD